MPQRSQEGLILWIMDALRQIESGGNYGARNNVSSASGAYQMIDSTWGNYGGYAHAWQAPARVQDARAYQLVLARFHAYGGDVAKTAASWFYPAYAGDKSKWNLAVPGNSITVGQYVSRFLG